MTILNLYMGGGKGTHHFPPSIDVWTPVRIDASTPVRIDASTPVGVYAHLLSFSFFGFFFFKREFLLKIAFPSCIFYYGLVCVENLASQQQKSENQKILHTFAPLETQNVEKIVNRS